MNARKIGITLLAIALASAACQPAPEAGPLADEDVAAIEGLADAYANGALAGDWDAVAAVYSEDAVFMMPDQPAVEGKAAWRAMMDEMQATVQAMSLEIAEIDGRGDLAFLRGEYSETFTMAGAEEPVEAVGKWVWILRRQPDGSWLVTLEIYNSNQPAAE